MSARKAINILFSAYGDLDPNTLPPEAGDPAMVYSVVNHEDITGHDGLSGVERIRFQLTIWSKSYKAAAELDREMTLALSGQRHTVLDPVAGENLLVNNLSRIDGRDGGMESGHHRQITEWIMIYAGYGALSNPD